MALEHNPNNPYFNLRGVDAANPDWFARLAYSSSGLQALCNVTAAGIAEIRIWPGKTLIPGTDLAFTLTVIPAEAAAVVVFKIENSDENETAREVFHLCLLMDIYLNLDNRLFADNAPVYDFGDRTGFYTEGVSLRANFHLRNWPFVTNATTYWYGPSRLQPVSHWVMEENMSYTGTTDSHISLSWQDQVIAAGETKWLSFVVTWGFGSRPPSLEASDAKVPNPVHFSDYFTLTGKITDEDSETGSLVAVFDGNLSTMFVVADNISCNSPFSVEMRLEDANIREGEHSIDLYAFDETGDISTNAVRITVTCIAPTLAATWTPSDSPTESASPFPTDTMTYPETKTPTESPTPSPSPYVDIDMSVSSDVDSKTNFRLQGIRRSNPGARIDISARGFDSSWHVSNVEAGGNSSSGIFSRLSSVEALGLQLATNFDASGSTAVVQFVVTNPLPESRNVSIVLSTSILLGENRHVQIRIENDAGSFRIVNDLTHFQVFARNYPLVVDVDSYWFGPASQLATSAVPQVPADATYNADDAALALSWVNRIVPPRTRIVLSALMSWGEVSNPPKASIPDEELPPDNKEMAWDTNVSIAGKIDVSTTPAIEEIVVYLVVDGEIVQEFRPDANGGFTISFSPAALRLTGGSHVFQIYAVDAGGSIAPLASFSNVVLAPTVPQTATAAVTDTPTASATASASWGEVVDVPWQGDPGIETADEGVSQVTVGKIVIGVGIPIGIILIVGFGFLIHRYQGALRADMRQQLTESSAAEPGSTGMGI
jgi:hypothetical protein